MEIQPIHPFPARMAPEIALAELGALPPDSLILDPMVGSGTVVRLAAERGHRALGIDLDPLAVVIARVWTTPLDTRELRAAAQEVARACDAGGGGAVDLPWIDDDPETAGFVSYWFAEPQRSELRQLSHQLRPIEGPVGDALRTALSRIIITKDRGASLARDVSHSRPHRVRCTNDFPVVAEFLRSVRRLAERLECQPPPGRTRIERGDARCLAGIPNQSVDAVITSPPYLNALDYLRGHRLALVWLGYRLSELRAIRAASIGVERAPADELPSPIQELRAALGPLEGLSRRHQRIVERYLLDLHQLVREIKRVLRPDGTAVLAVGNSCLRGVFIQSSRAVIAAAEQVGLTRVRESERALPPGRRYLPPPGAPDPGPARGAPRTPLERRMHRETVLTFRRG